VHELAALYWNPSRFLFWIPLIHVPVTWYGLLFSTGFLSGFYLFRFQLCRELSADAANACAEKLSCYLIVATIVGARLGHIIFYENPFEYFLSPISILKTWEGGLASHFGILANVIAIWVFAKKVCCKWPSLNFLHLLDLLVIPALFVGCLIRLGNFMNQEILGIPTDMPWGIIFGNPLSGEEVVARHPAQLYESGIYLLLFCIFGFLWQLCKLNHLNQGFVVGINCVIVGVLRFFVEYFKVGQSVWFDYRHYPINMGQLLSLPMIFFGLFLLVSQEKNFVKIFFRKWDDGS